MAATSIHDDNTVRARSKYAEREMLLRKLELSYVVLRENPSVVASGIKATPREQYLTAKLNDAKRTITQIEEEKCQLHEKIAMLEKMMQKNCKKEEEKEQESKNRHHGGDDSSTAGATASGQGRAKRRCRR